MRATLCISMYSGVKNPEVELTEEQSQKMIELVDQLTQPFEGDEQFIGLSGLRTDSYIVFWKDDTDAPPFVALRAEPYGFVYLWRNNGDLGVALKDTAGLWNFLNPIGIQLYDEHCKDVAKTMAAHYEEMSRISGQTKI
jgi:hypothetical protein